MNLSSIRVDERQAREVLLARAVETVDTQGKLISDVERDELDLKAIEEARAGATGTGNLDVAPALCARARRVLDIVARRDADLTSLRDIPSWRQSVVWGLPLLALLLGILTDQIANPHRVDLLSLPLLAIVLWNLAVYVLLLVQAVRRPGSRDALHGLRALVGRLLASSAFPRRRSRQTRGEVRTRFLLFWHATAARLNVHRVTMILHLAAAAWGAGVALSLFIRGLVVQYRIGWESTFLSPEQVQLWLNVLFSPVIAVLSLAPFTLQDIAAMRFDAGAADPVLESGRRWVYMYAGLLLIVVVAPRLLLAVVSWCRVLLESRRLMIDLSEPYFQQLIDRLIPSRVKLWIHSHRDEDRTALVSVLSQHVEPGAGDVLLRTSTGDVLQKAVLSQSTAVTTSNAAALSVIRARLFRTTTADDFGGDTSDRGDVVLHVVGAAADLEAPMPALGHPDAPILLLVNPQQGERDDLIETCRLHKKHHDAIAEVLAFDSFARCWVQEPLLFEAISPTVPRSKSQGFQRLVSTWEERNRARFKRSMSVLAATLVHSAREVEGVRSAPLSIKNLLSREHREARSDAKATAMAAVVGRLRMVEAAALHELLELHRLGSEATDRLEQGLEVTVDTQTAVNAPQAGLAGAASGAAMGASVDLVTGGLTLGVAALLGALVGGSAAFLSAAWNNRKTPGGATTILLSDQMLQALVEASLLRYLAVIHLGRGARSDAGDAQPEWNSEVIANVAAHRNRLQPLWAAAREPELKPSVAGELAAELEAIATRVLRNLYPQARVLAG